MIAESGGTRHFAYLELEEKEHQIKLQVVLQMFGIPCTAFGKIAVAFTILRIVVKQSVKWYVWSLWALIVLTALTAALDVLLVLFQCGAPPNLWNLAAQDMGTPSCLDKNAVYNFNTFVASFQAFADFFLALLPIHIIWRLQMSLRRKLTLVALLGLTTFTGIAAAVKTYLASKNLGVAADPTWDMYLLAIWASVEVALIVICGSVPALVPLWERLMGRHRHRRQGYGSAGYMPPESKPGSKQYSRNGSTTMSREGAVGYSNTAGVVGGRMGVITAGRSDSSLVDIEMARLTQTHVQDPWKQTTLHKISTEESLHITPR